MVFRNPFDKLSEVQAHSSPIERMRLSFDGNYLFTVGQDGCLIIFDVKERSERGTVKNVKENMSLAFSEEILTEKQEIDGYITEKENLENDL